MKKQHESTAAPAIDADPGSGVLETFANDALVTQPQLKRIAGNVSDMTIWRWRRAGLLPEPTSIRGRNYWPVRDIRAALGRLMQVQGGVAA